MNANETQKNDGVKSFIIKITASVIASAVVAFVASYVTTQVELGDMKRRLAYVESATDPAMKALFAHSNLRLDKTENAIDELRKAINDLKNDILPQLAEIRANVLHIKEDVSRNGKSAKEEK